MTGKTVALGLIAIGTACGAVSGMMAERHSDAIIAAITESRDPVTALLETVASRPQAASGAIEVRVERGLDARGLRVVDVVVPVADRDQCAIAVTEGAKTGAQVAQFEGGDPCARAYPSEVRLRHVPGDDT